MPQKDQTNPQFPSSTTFLRSFLWIAVFALVYFVAARYSLFFTFQPEGISAICPATGIFLSALLLTRRGLRPWMAVTLFLVDLAAELSAGNPLALGLAYAAAMTGEALLGLWLLGRFAETWPIFRNSRQVLEFIFLCSILATGAMAVFAAGSAALLAKAPFGASWLWWWASDSVGSLLVTPLLMSWAYAFHTRFAEFKKKRVFEGLLLLALSGFLSNVVFSLLPENGWFILLLNFLIFPFLVWAAIRFRILGVTTTSALLGFVLFSYANSGVFAQFGVDSITKAVVVVQAFIAMITIPSLLLATVITERRQAEQEIQRLALIVDIAPNSITIHDFDGHFLYVNQRSLDMHGYTRAEFMALNLHQLDAPESEQMIDPRMNELNEKGEATFEVTHLRKDGSLLPLEVSASLTTWEGKKSVLSVARDLSIRKQVEKLQQAVYRISQTTDQVMDLESLFPAVHAIIQQVMPAGNFYIALYDEKNDLISFPYAVDEVDPPFPPKKLGKGLTEYVLRTGKPLICDQARFDELQQQGEVEPVGAPSPIWLGVPLIIEGKTIGVMVVQDYKNARAYGQREQDMLEFVSSQVAMAIHNLQADEALRESEARLRALTDGTRALLVNVDTNGHFFYANEATATLLGFKNPEELIGKPYLHFIHPEDRPRVLESFTSQVEKLQPSNLQEFRIVDTRGKVKWYSFLSTLIVENGQVVGQIGVAQNIAERKQAEQKILQMNAELEQRVADRTRELQAAQEKLIRQEKLAVLGQMAGSVGHELRNPLGVINTAVYYLNMVQPDADEKVRQHHAIIRQEVRNANKIIGELLDFARLKSVDRQPVSVDLLVRQTLDRFPVPAELELKLDLPADLPMALADPRHLEQVLGNLVTNACQAMAEPGAGSATGAPDPKTGSTTRVKEHGRLTISAHHQKRSEKAAQDLPGTAGDEEEMLSIAVSDTGTGIPAENMSKLFEPLFTTRTRGIGLGLPISQKLVEANGGRIEVASEPGKGSIFTIYLPLAPSKVT